MSTHASILAGSLPKYVPRVQKYSTSLIEKEYPFLPRSPVTVMLYELGCLLYWLVMRRLTVFSVTNTKCQSKGEYLSSVFWGLFAKGPLPWETYFQFHSLSIPQAVGPSTQTNPYGTDFLEGNHPLPGFAYYYCVSLEVPSELPRNCHSELGQAETVLGILMLRIHSLFPQAFTY